MKTLTDNPRDYDVPFPSWYENQRELAQRAVNLGRNGVLVIESPTGSGKSTLPAIVSYFRPHTFSLMGTRELQVQYAQSLPMFTILWGQEHYECVNEPWSAFIEDRYRRKATHVDCPLGTIGMKNCNKLKECPYELAKLAVMGARAVATNYACAWHNDWWRPVCEDTFLDEAHTVAYQILDMATVEVPDKTRRVFDLPRFPVIEEGEQGLERTYGKVRAWLSTSKSILKRLTRVRGRSKLGLWARRVYLSFSNLLDRLRDADEGDWFIRLTDGTLKAEPIRPGPFIDNLVPESSRTAVLMSATIGRPDILVKQLGLSERPWEFVSVRHPFPKENRPVFFVRGSPRINYRSGDKAYGLQADLVSDILDNHKGEKGIVHTASWRHARKLCELLSERGQQERLFLPKGKRLEKVEEFNQMPMGTVAVSPSWAEGLDLVGEMGTLSITAKVPFKPLGSPVEKIRLELPGGSDEYRQDAANKIAQQSGRIVRTPTDVGVTYIVDANWELVKGYAPDWFEVEMI